MSKRMIAAGVTVALATAAASAYSASGGALRLGPVTKKRLPTYKAYYDGHKDVFLVTDVSTRKQARALRINYAPALKAIRHLPAQYFVRGRAAHGQLSVFGSEPGETDYNPLWEEFFVTWKSGVAPVLLVRDDQIKALAKQGKLTLRDAHVVLNAPVTKVGK